MVTLWQAIGKKKRGNTKGTGCVSLTIAKVNAILKEQTDRQCPLVFYPTIANEDGTTMKPGCEHFVFKKNL